MKSRIKKFKFVAFALIMFAVIGGINLVFYPNTAYASTGLTSDDGLWEFTADGEILEYHGTDSIITIPEQLTANGVSYAISKLNSKAICDNNTTTQINIGPSITNIPTFSFKNLTSLTKINVSPENQQYCDINGILYSKDKTYLLKLPRKNPTMILELPQSFAYCMMNSIETAENVIVIKMPTYYTSYVNKMYNLTPEAFPNLMAILVPAENTDYISIDGVVYSHDMTKLCWYPAKKISSSFTIPDSVKVIAKNAFLNVEYLDNLNLTSNIEEIDVKNFSGCQITSINNITTREEYINWDPSIKSLFQKYLHVFEDLPISISLVEQEVQYAVDNYIEEGMKDIEKLNALYNYLAGKVFYTNGDVWDDQHHCLSSAFLGDETVCEGYAYAMSLLLDKVGIPNITASGYRHAWNVVQISGEWFNIDATWDDIGDYAGKSYYMKSTSQYRNIGHLTSYSNKEVEFTKYSFGVDKSIYTNNLPECNIIIGDIDRNGVVNDVDTYRIINEIQAYARYSRFGYYNILADVTLDGKIDEDDYNLLYETVILENEDILIGDLNQNGVYDEGDLALLEIEIERFESQPGYYNILADVLYDRVLDMVDYIILEDLIFYQSVQ